MKILWISNILFPEPCSWIGCKPPVLGGWMYASARSLMEVAPDLTLAVAALYEGDTLLSRESGGVTYYMLPSRKDKTRYQESLEKYWRQIVAEFKPDVVHLHGTEFPHGLSFIKACPDVKSVASIQGLISVYADHYLDGIPDAGLKSSLTLRDVVRKDSMADQKRKFEQRGVMECQLLKDLRYVIGRTEWDRTEVLKVNPSIRYFTCNETLRPVFYTRRWSYEECHSHTVFISQGDYPIKGLHQVLKALPLVLKEFPDTKVVVAGQNITEVSSFRERLLLSGYAKYLRDLIGKLGIGSHITFTGPLDADRMCAEYLCANVFVCPSSIENSTNSLCEAQLLGLPCIASERGGNPSMVHDSILYPFDDVESLSRDICAVFRDPSLGVEDAQIIRNRHDGRKNSEQLLSIYSQIV